MTTRTLNWCTATRLDCTVSATTVGYLCVNASIVDPAPDTLYGFVQALVTEVRASTCADPCGLCKFVYTISYNDEQLVAGFALTLNDIREVLCENCLVDFILDNSSANVTCTDVDNCIGEILCWNVATSESELIEFNTAEVGGILVTEVITLTADLTVTIPLSVAPCGQIVTGDNALVIEHYVPQGLNYAFNTSPCNVTFSLGAIDKAYPQWFGATGDGITNDCDALRATIKSFRNIYLPEGTYLVEPTTDSGQFMLYLGTANGNTDRSGMTIEGAGPRSIVKLGDDVGNAYLLFGSAITDSLYDMTFKDFTIDCNGQNNLQSAFGDPLRLNSAFYLFSYCENFKFENLLIENISGSQGIRIGDDTEPNIGKDITFTNCTFKQFGIAIANNFVQDCSVLYLEAENVVVDQCTFKNNDFTFDLSRGHTAIELHGKSNNHVTDNTFSYLQLPLLLSSTETDAVDTFVTGNGIQETAYIMSFDAAATGNEQSRVIISDNVITSTKSTTSMLFIGSPGEGAKTREQVLFTNNIINNTGNTNQQNHIIKIEDTYIKNIVIDGNDAMNVLGCLVYMAGTVDETNIASLKITNNRLDSLGATAGGFPSSPSFVLINPSAGTILSLVIDANVVSNTLAKDYTTFGIWRRGGNITYSYINDTKSTISAAYPLITGTLGTNTFKYESISPRNWNDNLFPYTSAFFNIATVSTDNIFDFSAFGVNDSATFIISAYYITGASNGVATWSVSYTSTGSNVTLINSAGTYGATVVFSFAGSVLRLGNASGGTITAKFTVQSGFSTLPTSWLH